MKPDGWAALALALLLLAGALLLHALNAPEAPGPAGWAARWAGPLSAVLGGAAALATWTGRRREAALLALLAATLGILALLGLRN